MHLKTIALSLLMMSPMLCTYGQIQQLFEKYYQESLPLFREYAIYSGDHRFDDQLDIEGANTNEKRKQFFVSYQKQLQAIDRTTLSEPDRISYDVLAFNLHDMLEGIRLHTEYFPMTQFYSTALNMGQYGSGSSVQPFKTVKDYENWAKRMTAFEEWTDTTIANFNHGIAIKMVLPKALVLKMIPQLETLAVRDTAKSIFYKPLNNFPTSFSSAEKKRLKSLYTKVINTKLLPSYDKLIAYLKNTYLPVAQDHDGLNALPNGRELYEYYFNRFTTTKGLTPEQLYQTGLHEVARITAEMEEIKTQVGFKGTLSEFFQFLKTDPQFMPFKTPDEVLQAYNNIYTKIKPHVDELFGLQPATAFEIKRVEAFREASQAGPSYVTGNLKENRSAIFYVPVRDATKLNVTFYGLEATFIHEAVPGHHFQISLQQENEQIPRFRKQPGFSVFTEGYALYCESLGALLGCYTDPYQKMGALNNEIHRAIRIVTDIGIHTGKMTRKEAIQYMLSHEAVSEDIAVAEAERYMAMPGQALSYKTGELKIKALRDKYAQQLGDKFSLKAFHDALLANGDMPLYVLEDYLDNWAAQGGK
ncbi:DUF885 domain-containing protein [Chitinophaga sancti]|uniref:DUF885 domain-containing protein n=1 Tax=Chitinophaga sancti TaxID=1004 RepID=UPI002A74A292|nr:DUF885 domain-containing protein [Chitinophaga sancti]WPQ66153.1 DUF885 domain-containing protein [Chitinophaga sancti]